MEKAVYSENHIKHKYNLRMRSFSFNIKGAGTYSYHSALKGSLSKGKVYGRTAVSGWWKENWRTEGRNSGSLQGHFSRGE
jgi:hypothetical protein